MIIISVVLFKKIKIDIKKLILTKLYSKKYKE